MAFPEPLVVETHSTCDIAVIWLHGLGADGFDFQDVVPALNLPDNLHIRFIFPHAKEIPVTANAGYVMRAWYDILEFSEERKINSMQLAESVNYVDALIAQQLKRGISSKRIVIAGFSQGGAVAYQVALNYSQSLAGLLTMSTYIAEPEALTFAAANKALPILIQHGQFDPVVLEQQADKALTLLQSKHYLVTTQRYPTEHNLCTQQVLDIGQWLTSLFH